MFKKALIIGLIVVLLAGVFGTIAGPPIREEIRTQLYHRWALEFEETWECIDIVGVTVFFDNTLEVYLRGRGGSCLGDAADAFYETEIHYLEKITEFWGVNVDYVATLYSPMELPIGIASEIFIVNLENEKATFMPTFTPVPARLLLWEGRGK